MAKQNSKSDVEFVRALAELLNENDLTELEVKREYGEADRMNVRVSRAKQVIQAAVQAAPQMAAPMAAAPAEAAATPAAAGWPPLPRSDPTGAPPPGGGRGPRPWRPVPADR